MLLIESEISNDALTEINKYPHLGKLDIMPNSEALNSLSDIKDDDVVISYNYCTDNVDADEANEFDRWLNHVLFFLDKKMSEMGYAEIQTLDGSGGGLDYGIVQYRKVVTTIQGVVL